MKIAALLATQVVVMSVSALTPGEAKPASSPSIESAQAQIQNVMAERLRASLSGDTAAISRSMTDDYIQTDISGHTQDKATWLREYFVPLAGLIKSGKFKWERYDHCDLKFRIHNDVAVVTGRLDAKGVGAKWVPDQHTWAADPKGSFGGSLYFTHVYRREGGSWVLAALQNAVPVGTSVAPTEKCH